MPKHTPYCVLMGLLLTWRWMERREARACSLINDVMPEGLSLDAGTFLKGFWQQKCGGGTGIRTPEGR